MGNGWKPNRSGYICHWLISGNYLTTPEVSFTDPNQLKFEKDLRAVIFDRSLTAPPGGVQMGGEGLPGMPWRYYQAGNNWFIDTSTFYYSLTRVELYACTELISDTGRKVRAKIRTFAAVDLWLNGALVSSAMPPVYKPIRNQDIVLNLQKGRNTVFLRMQNLGVRDTRNIVGLQLFGNRDGITVSLPDPDHTVAAVAQADGWLGRVACRDGRLVSDCEPPCPVTVKANGRKSSGEAPAREETFDDGTWSAGCEYPISPRAEGIRVSAEVCGQPLQREWEIIGNIRPEWESAPDISIEEHRKRVIRNMARFRSAGPGSGGSDNSYFTLARYICGRNTDKDDAIILADLDRIHRRVDCSDFYLSALLRLFLRFDVKNEAVRARIKEVCLDFRYWMDEKGSDGMCFWSENHALLFFGNAMMAGRLFPDEMFTRSGRTGKEQEKIAAGRCREWLDSVDEYGFEEFLSGGYMCTTASALLCLIDFGPADVSAHARKVLDKLLNMLCRHTFRGIVCGPRGRVYRDVLYPFRQGVQALIYYITPAVPVSFSMWIAGFGCTGYRIPSELAARMESDADETYPNGNGEITIRKTRDYLLSSVNSPRVFSQKGWSDEACQTGGPYVTGRYTYAFTKALNERFHGTTRFEPGVYGYQQHMWCAVLDTTCLVFSNHPGGTHERTEMRPGYWNGNGLMPALLQKGNRLGMIYVLRDEHPVNFTHLFWPTHEFDRVVQTEGWLFGQKGDSYIGVWCNVPYVPHNDILTDCEYRAYSEKVAYLCYCSGRTESGSFEAFMEKTAEKSPSFRPEIPKLSDSDGFELVFVEKHNDSQYI